jgi:hypothetical protein
MAITTAVADGLDYMHPHIRPVKNVDELELLVVFHARKPEASSAKIWKHASPIDIASGGDLYSFQNYLHTVHVRDDARQVELLKLPVSVS